MIVQATNGRFYRNPTIINEKWYLHVDDCGAFIKRKGRVSWRTARSPLRSAGIKCVIDHPCTDGKAILHGAFTTVSIFKIKLRGPIPVPTHSEAELHFTPSEKELNGERLLTWQ